RSSCSPCSLPAILRTAPPNSAEPATFLASAVWRIEGEQTRIEFLEGATAAWTTHLSAHDNQTIFRVEQTRSAATDLECALGKTTRFQNPPGVDHADDDVD